MLIDPASGTPYPSTATPGEQPDGSYALNNGVVNFSYDLTQEQGVFNTASGYPDAALPGHHRGGQREHRLRDRRLP